MTELVAKHISHIVVEVADLERAQEFYGDLLGFTGAAEGWPDCTSRHLVFGAASGQSLILAETKAPRAFPDSGVHQAYRAGATDIAAICSRLKGAGVEIFTYKEDRPAEEGDNLYVHDPDGNRIQLVADGGHGKAGVVRGIDHAAVMATDLEWEEDFYVDVLGLEVEFRLGWNTADYVRAQLWAEGKEDMAPGTRRWDERYRDIPGRKPSDGRRVARPNSHFFVIFGQSVLGVFLANRFDQEPPEEILVGTPRIAFEADEAGLDAAARLLEDRGRRFHGPVSHDAGAPVARSLYFKDPCGNFLELTHGH
ncbi:MAG: VOC family protein [Alphaproteobacteria bacterium]